MSNNHVGSNGDAGPSTLRVSAPNSKGVISATSPHSAPANMSTFPDDIKLDVIPTRAGRKLCVRHKQMASQNVNERLQKTLDSLPDSERSAVTQLWSTFSNSQHSKRKLILEGILTMCCFSQLSHISDSLNQIIRIDPFSLLPREVNLRILGYLDAITLGRAAQVSKSWKALADDDLLWRRMCGQHIDRKCEKCGWGLPLLERRRLKVELNERSPAVAIGIGHHHHDHGHDHKPQEVATRAEALGVLGGITNLATDTPASSSSTLGKRANGESSAEPIKRMRIDLSGSDTEMEEVQVVAESSGTIDGFSREKRLTRPWKSVYCERLVVERNWRKGRCKTLSLKGHDDGVMCLQYHTTLNSPSYPVLITGSYDRTVRVWNLNTGEAVHVLRGHTRAVRALQFDQMLLFTGAMDGTVRMWNWRAGECLRVLEGHTDGVVSLSYNGYLLATGSADHTIQVWNFRTGTKFTLRGHEDWVNTVQLWDGKSSPGDVDPTQLPSFPYTGKTASGTAAPKRDKTQPDLDKGAMLFSGSDDGTVKLWDLETQQCMRTFRGHKGQVQSLKVIMLNMSEDEIEETRRESARRSATPPPATSAFQTAASLSPTGNASPASTLVDLAPAGFDAANHATHRGDVLEPKIYVHDTDSEGGSKSSTSKSKVNGKGKEEKRAMLVTGALDGTVKLWDIETGLERKTCFGHIEGVWGVDVDALRIASASHDRTVKIWDRETAKCVHTFTGHRGAVTSLQLSDDMIVSGSDDGDVMVWNFAPSNAPATPGVQVVTAQILAEA